MKSSHRLLFIILLLLCAAAGSESAHAAPKPMSTTNAVSSGAPFVKPLKYMSQEDAFTKLGRGLTNIIEGPFELYTQTALVPSNNEILYTFFVGVTKGLGMFVTRELVGVYDIVTFPFPIPEGYKPLIEPATTFTDFEWRKSIAQS